MSAHAQQVDPQQPLPHLVVEWFLPISALLKRVLKPTGSFILNIKEPVVNGERHTYVIELILAMRQKPGNSLPGFLG